MKTKYMTKKSARQIIEFENEMQETAYCEGVLTVSYMEDMLRFRMDFGEAETKFIIASLVNAGAKFIVEED